MALYAVQRALQQPERSAERLGYGHWVRLKTALAHVGQLDHGAARARVRLRPELFSDICGDVAIQRFKERPRRRMFGVAEDAPDRPHFRNPPAVEHENQNRRFHE